MINKIIANYLSLGKRLVIPSFGAFIHKEDNGAVVFVPFLKKDDGVLTGLLGKEYGLGEAEALGVISDYVGQVQQGIAQRGAFLIEGMGTLRADANGLVYLDYQPGLRSASPETGTDKKPGALPPSAPSATADPIPPVTPVAAGSAPSSATPASTPASPVATSSASSPVSRPVSAASADPAPAARATAPGSSASAVSRPSEAKAAVPPPASSPSGPDPTPPPARPAEASSGPATGRGPGAPSHPGSRGPVPPRPAAPATRSDRFMVIAILAAVIALASIVYGLVSSSDGPQIDPMELPAPHTSGADSLPAATPVR